MNEADRVDAEILVRRWRDAIVTKDWAAFAPLYTDDAVAMPPNVPLVAGRARIAEWFASPGVSVTAFAVAPVAIEGDGRCVVIRTAYAMTFIVPGAAALTERGKGVLVLRRGGDEAWRIAIDIWNADAPAAAV